MKKIIIVVAIVVVVAAIAFFGRQYYLDRYASSDYYTVIPASYNVVPETILSDNGEDMGLGKEYNLTAYSANGEKKSVSFTVFAPGSDMASARELPKPGDYLLVKASATIVTNWEVINKSSVPQGALEKIG
ncbi:MAG: YxeA family protein [Coriobacteriales bacterium]|nr:YxeA family protein [Coriobacteriales bacterium]